MADIHVMRVLLSLLIATVNARTLRNALLRHNLALNRLATQSSFHFEWNNYTADLAVDGNFDDDFTVGHSCTHTEMSADEWWMVDLGEEFLVYEVHVQNRGDCCYERLADVDILIGMTPSAMELCYHFDGPGVRGYYEFQCNERLHGRYVKLYKYFNSDLSLCEVVVLGTYPNDDLPYNLALQMETTFSAPDADGGLAVDGNSNPDAAFCTNIISSSYDQWWMVDLDRHYLITAVDVRNRGDCCGDHFADVDVLVGMDVARFRLCHHYDGPGADSENIPFLCARRIRGRFVKVVKHGGQPLTLCEAFVRATLLSASGHQGLLERLQNGGQIVMAEGYLWEMERRGFAQFGEYMPTVVIDRPDALRNLHEEFALAGSDVIQAFTYYAHREQFRLKGRECDLEKVNRDALKIAREVADDFGKLMAGGLSNTPLYKPDDEEVRAKLTAMFKEQVEWAVEGGADFIIGETFGDYGEALLALQAIKQFGHGLPAVITLAAYCADTTLDDVPVPEACRRLEEHGAAVVGVNCARGPDVMMPLVKEIRQVCKGPIAALPVAYRTTDDNKSFQAVTDPVSGERLYPDDLDSVRCNKSDIRRFGEAAREAGVQYVGLCCGNAPNLTRELAQTYGRRPPASRFTCDHTKSWIFGDSADERMVKQRKLMLGTQ